MLTSKKQNPTLFRIKRHRLAGCRKIYERLWPKILLVLAKKPMTLTFQNQTFLGVWSSPETYSIIGSRHYDYRDAKNPDDNRAVIDVLYDWGYSDSLDNQYPGQKILKSFIFVFEDGAWKLDDIYNFTDTYASPGSLSAYFSRAK
jgi:hypothetical protein